MMLLAVILWILVIANAPWWVWTLYVLHIIGTILSEVLDNDLERMRNKLNE